MLQIYYKSHDIYSVSRKKTTPCWKLQFMSVKSWD